METLRIRDKTRTLHYLQLTHDVTIVCDDTCINSAFKEVDWIIDLRHITPGKEMFTSYTGCSFSKVKMASQGVIEIVNIRGLSLMTNMGCKILLKNIRIDLNMHLNIVSIGKLDDIKFAHGAT